MKPSAFSQKNLIKNSSGFLSKLLGKNSAAICLCQQLEFMVRDHNNLQKHESIHYRTQKQNVPIPKLDMFSTILLLYFLVIC